MRIEGIEEIIGMTYAAVGFIAGGACAAYDDTSPYCWFGGFAIAALGAVLGMAKATSRDYVPSSNYRLPNVKVSSPSR